MRPFTRLLRSGFRAANINASRTSGLGKDISNVITRLGKDAPQIQTRNIHGITTRFLGGPLSEKHEKELTNQIYRMKRRYPEAHRSIDQLFVDNRPEELLGKKTGFAYLDENNGLIDPNSAGFAGPVLKGKKLKTSIGIRTSFIGGPSHSTASNISDLYTHEFGHVIQNHLAIIEGNLNVNVKRGTSANKRYTELVASRMDSVNSMNKVATAPLEKRLVGEKVSLYKDGVLDPVVTHHAFGSAYAARQYADPETGLINQSMRNMELIPELLALQNRNRMSSLPNRNSMSYGKFRETEQGMKDFDVQYKARNKENREFIMEKYGYDPFAPTRSTARNGVSSRGRNSSKGGMAYLYP